MKDVYVSIVRKNIYFFNYEIAFFVGEGEREVDFL